jgi:hypothetical protein
MHPSTDAARTQHLVTTMAEHMSAITHTLATWIHDQPHTLADLEHHVLRLVKDLGSLLLSGLSSLAAPAQPPSTVSCSCGHLARYQRLRPAQVTSLLGPISILRPYYLCAGCGHGQHPLDLQLQLCAGSRSAGLDELLALLGSTQDSFAQAASVLERLTLVHISPNSVRDATEELGQTLLAHHQQAVADGLDGTEPPDVTTPPPERLYITMDGVLAHLHERGWSELKVGCCYQTSSKPEPKRPEHLEIRAHSLSYISSLSEAHSFGYQLWQEAARRGVREAKEVVVLGDGAHWIWNIADAQFAGATQIVDWYHASSYVWKAASAIWGEVHPQREAWVHRQLEQLWEGKVEQVLKELTGHQDGAEGVSAAVTYFTEHGKRMDYAVYRARGLQIGSGSVESACKQVVSARLKGAGMIWDATGAERVATVRAWLKSERWQEAMALRAAPGRSYERQQARPRAEESSLAEAAPRGRLDPDVLARVRAEMAQEEDAPHPWRKAWSVRRQREQSLEQMQTTRTTLAA